jgi:hypothetical protein
MICSKNGLDFKLIAMVSALKRVMEFKQRVFRRI